MTLRVRFTLLIAAAVSLSNAGFSAALLWTESRHLTQELDRHRREEVRKLSLLCRESRLSRDEIGLLNYLREMQRDGALWALFMDTDGRVAAHADPAQRGRLLDDPLSREISRADALTRRESLWEGKPLVEYAAPVDGPRERWGMARIAYDPAQDRRRLGETLAGGARRFAGVGLAALAGSLLLAWATAARLSAPLRRLAESAVRVGAGDLSIRVPAGGSGEIGALSRAFNRMAEGLGQLDAMKDAFIHTVSHDLRNPLGAIRMSAQIILTDGHPAPADKKMLSVILSSADRLGTMVGNILDMAQIKENRISYHRSPLRPEKLIKEVMDLYQASAQGKGVSIAAHVAPGLPAVFADEEKIHRVLTNLFSNALKFTRSGGSITLAAAPAEDPGFVRFSVADTGVGISPASQATLFQKFSRAPDLPRGLGAQQGTGLGLAIVKTLVEGHGGALHLDSTPGKGSAFTWTLPVVRAADLTGENT